MLQVTPSVYITSVLNPNMRTFDVIMRTEFGTSYNSYVVIGNNKIALIEASHKTFGVNYLEHLQKVLGDRVPDYLVLNHCEPDHTGSINEVINAFPSIEIVVTKAGSNFIKNIANLEDLKIRVVKDNDSLDLGGKTLEFIIAPLLHWPDTMFTWLKEENVLFSCDFLGSHYCEPQLFDSRIVYKKDFLDAVKNYFACIFEPFIPNVIYGLDKIKDLNIDYACTSHGPVLTKGVYLEKILSLYREWTMEPQRKGKYIPIFYCSAYGNTAMLADSIASGIKKALPNSEVELFDLVNIDPFSVVGKLNSSDAFLLGSPTINREAVPPIWILLSYLESVVVAKKPAALFGTYGWSGEALKHISRRLEDLKVAEYEDQFKVVFVPTKEDLEAAKAFGESFAKTL